MINVGYADYIKSDYVVPANLVEEDIQLQIALAESQEDADKRKQLEEIEELTDKYKLTLAVEKNTEEVRERQRQRPTISH